MKRFDTLALYLSTTAFLSSFVFATTPFAQETAPAPAPIQNQDCEDDDQACSAIILLSHTLIPELIVTATRSPRPKAEIGSTVTVIPAIEIETKQFQFVSDALALSPGISLARNSAFGGVSSINIRGSSSRQSLVLIDGIVVNDPSAPSGGFNFANLDVTDIDRIEVLRGPQSILYGSEAVGGVISIQTKRPVNDFELNTFVEGGSFATVRAGANIGGLVGRADYRVSVFGIRTDGISRADEDNGNTEKDGFDSIATSANIGIDLTDDFRLESFFRYGTSALEFDGFPPPNFSLADSDDNDSTEEIAIAGRALLTLFDDRFTNTLTVGYSDIQRNNFSGDVFTFGAEGDRVSVDYLGRLQIVERVAVTLGAETEETRIDTGTIVDSLRINSVFGLGEASVLDTPVTKLTLTGGVRFDDHETFGGVTTARVTGAWQIFPAELIIRGSWGEGFSAPSLFQLNATFGPGEPNRDLQPEESQGWDIGLEKEITFNALGDITINATYFNQDTDNLIDFNFATGAFFNIAETSQKGVEVALSWQPHDDINFTSAYTYTDADNITDGSPILRQPEHRVFSNIDWQATNNFSLSLGITYNGPESDVGGTNDDFVRVDVRGAYTLSDSLELFGRIENLTDANYQDIRGFGEPGISVFGGLRVKL